MKKFEALKCARSICRVSGIGFFLFCAALFCQPAKAEIIIGKILDDTCFYSATETGFSVFIPTSTDMIVADLENYGDPGTMHFYDLQNTEPNEVFGFGIGTRHAYWLLSDFDKGRSATTSISLEDYDGHGYLTIYAIDLGGAELLSTSTETWFASPANITSDTNNNLIFGQFYRNSGGAFSVFEYTEQTINQTYPDYCAAAGYVFYKGLFSDPNADHESTFNFAPHTNFAGMGVVYNFTPIYDDDEDQLIDFFVGDCCAGQECIVPIDFPEGLDGATLYTNLDAVNCVGWHTPDDTIYTLDFFNKTPEYILLDAANEGVHWLCAWTAGGEAEPALYHIPFNYYNATNSPYCVLSRPIETPDFCSDEQLGCGNFQISSSTWDSLFCGLKQAGCWFVVPASTSLNYIGDRANLLKSKFPFNLYFDVLDNLEEGFATTTDSRAGSIGVPMYSASSSSFYFITIADASSTEKAIGKTNATLFRKTQGWIIWGAVAFYLLLRLRPKQA